MTDEAPITLWGVRAAFGGLALPAILSLPWGEWGGEFGLGAGMIGGLLGVIWWLTDKRRGWVREGIGDFM